MKKRRFYEEEPEQEEMDEMTDEEYDMIMDDVDGILNKTTKGVIMMATEVVKDGQKAVQIVNVVHQMPVAALQMMVERLEATIDDKSCQELDVEALQDMDMPTLLEILKKLGKK